MRKFIVLFIFFITFVSNEPVLAIEAPSLTVTTSGVNVSLTWTPVSGATEYSLHYAPNPYTGPSSIQTVSMGTQTSYSTDLWYGASFFVTITSTDGSATSGYSNIELFTLEQTVPAQSFSPMTNIDGNGNSSNASWAYRITNNTSFDVMGSAMNMNFSDLEVEIDHNALTRQTAFSGSISGSMSGNFNVHVLENLATSGTSTTVNSQNFNMAMALSGYGQNINLNMILNTSFSSPVQWFLDNSSLDELAIGHVYTGASGISADSQGSIVFSMGSYSETIPVQQTLACSERWEIIGHEASMTVQGVIYSNIVVVKRTTVLPKMDISNTSSIEMEQSDILYWVAKGIGMIKGVGQFDFLGEALTIELVQTNLSQ
jgi:hypothetical protein